MGVSKLPSNRQRLRPDWLATLALSFLGDITISA